MPSNGWLELECNDAHTALPERSSDLSISVAAATASSWLLVIAKPVCGRS
jgi:hypothetical protein